MGRFDLIVRLSSACGSLSHLLASSVQALSTLRLSDVCVIYSYIPFAQYDYRRYDFFFAMNPVMKIHSLSPIGRVYNDLTAAGVQQQQALSAASDPRLRFASAKRKKPLA